MPALLLGARKLAGERLPAPPGGKRRPVLLCVGSYILAVSVLTAEQTRGRMEAMNDDVPTIRRAIAALSPSKTQRRYPEALSRRIAALARSHPGRGPSSLARRLDMAPQTLARVGARAKPVLGPGRV